MQKIILVTGKPAPPIGGVTVFLKYFYQASESAEGVELRPFSFRNFFFNKSDAVHINASNHLKRLLYILLAKAFFKKVYFVKHGGPFPLDNTFVRVSFGIADGVFCLNKEVFQQLSKLNVNCLQHTTIFSENAQQLKSLYKTPEQGVQRVNGKPNVLFYINNDRLINGVEIYGANFILDCMPQIDNNFNLTVVDLSVKFNEKFASFKNVTYVDSAQDFKKLLTQHDVYIRPTSSDGMSLAVLEAGLLNVNCLASDVVERPSFVSLYKYGDKEDFIRCLNQLAEKEQNKDGQVSLSSVSQVFDFMFPQSSV